MGMDIACAVVIGLLLSAVIVLGTALFETTKAANAAEADANRYRESLEAEQDLQMKTVGRLYAAEKAMFPHRFTKED